MQKIKHIKNYLTKKNILVNLMKKIFIDVRWSKGYSDEFEKLTRDGNGLTITIMLKEIVLKKKTRWAFYVL